MTGIRNKISQRFQRRPTSSASSSTETSQIGISDRIVEIHSDSEDDVNPNVSKRSDTVTEASVATTAAVDATTSSAGTVVESRDRTEEVSSATVAEEQSNASGASQTHTVSGTTQTAGVDTCDSAASTGQRGGRAMPKNNGRQPNQTRTNFRVEGEAAQINGNIGSGKSQGITTHHDIVASDQANQINGNVHDGKGTEALLLQFFNKR
ncbi:uncharacterized protein I206_104482 [Kwoniella pini CBS 10737]|uniref:Uncharacterized protein n=1 Tax=Kwoniella pini CBS 10737 TaxID=1296096 RepID=A0A1B9I6X7_9TREE|nr:uncharacterized protein I206_02012 [Kwoniella pini CBS 10737]OCF51298.1 hypothetical protein I206_02012 [Kwoniella pini CBS 10737]